MKAIVNVFATLIVSLFLVAILGFIFLFGALIASDTIANNKIVTEYSNKFQTLEHPENTSLIKSF